MGDGEPTAPTAAAPSLSSFRTAPETVPLAEWRALLAADRTFPIESHRGGLIGRLVVAFKRLLRPFVVTPQADLWDRQRALDLAVVARLERLAQVEAELHATVDALRRTVETVHAEAGDRLARHETKFEDVDRQHRLYDERVGHLDRFMGDGIRDLMAHDDALFSLLDQKLDRARRESAELRGALQSALARVEAGAAGAAGGAPIAAALDEAAYLELERRFRGSEAEIAERLAAYLPLFDATRGEVLDLGCGRGELLRLLAARGVPARGVDASAEMVRRCTDAGLRAEQGDLLAVLAAAPAGSLGGVVSFHVVEHLPPEVTERLVRLAWSALAPGGVLVLETPNPLSMAVSARSFWLDPTHRRPVHPASLRLAAELAGFDPVEIRWLRPFPDAERLPELDLVGLPPEQRPLADGVNRLRDRLDELIFGCQDYALVARKPG